MLKLRFNWTLQVIVLVPLQFEGSVTTLIPLGTTSVSVIGSEVEPVAYGEMVQTTLEPGRANFGLAETCSLRLSDGTTVVVTEAELLLGVVSFGVVIAAVLVYVPAVPAVRTCSANDADAPEASVGIEQVTTDVPLHADGSDVAVNPAASVSVTTIDDAASGPAFATFSVMPKSPFVRTRGAPAEAVMETSACAEVASLIVVLTLALLFEVLVSGRALETVAEFVIVPEAVGRIVTVIVVCFAVPREGAVQ